MRPRLRDNLLLDWLWAFLFVGVHILIVWWTGSGDILAWNGGSSRGEFYAAIATTVGILFAVGTTAASLYATSDRPRIRWLREEVRAHSYGIGIITAPLRSLFLLLVVSLIAIAIDPAVDNSSSRTAVGGASWIRWLVEFMTVLAGWRFSRLMRVFNSLIGAAAAEEPREKVEQKGVGYDRTPVS